MSDEQGIAWHQVQVKLERLANQQRLHGRLRDENAAAVFARIAAMERATEADLRAYAESQDAVISPHEPVRVVWTCRVEATAYVRPEGIDEDEFRGMVERAPLQDPLLINLPGASL